MDGNFEQNQNWQDPNQGQSGQNWQDPNQGQFNQNWQDPNQNQQNQNPYYNGYNNGQQNNGYTNVNGYPTPNVPNQGYTNNGGYNNYMPNNYNGPIVVSNAAPARGGGLAVGSLVCGIISVICFWSYITLILAIVGVVLGAVNNAQDNANKGMAIAGIILNVLGALLTFILIIFAVSLLQYF